jgi:ABC transporter substrate binding protein
MNENSNVFPLRQPGNIDDPLTDILRSGARRLLAQAIELEAETFLETMNDLKLADGRDRLVRHGHGPERAIQTGGLDASQSARVDAVNVLASPFVPPARATIIDWFNRARLPAIYELPEIAEQGGLLGYGPRLELASRLAARLVSRILRGARPEDLPVEQPDRIDLVVNLKTANVLGLSIPPSGRRPL